MTSFWEFAKEHWFITTLLAFGALNVVQDIGVGFAKALSARAKATEEKARLSRVKLERKLQLEENKSSEMVVQGQVIDAEFEPRRK